MKGIDYGEIGRLCQNQKIIVPPGTPQYIDGLDTILLAYLDYKRVVEGVEVRNILKEWGTPERHWHWFDSARKVYRTEYLEG